MQLRFVSTGDYTNYWISEFISAAAAAVTWILPGLCKLNEGKGRGERGEGKGDSERGGKL